MGRQIPLHFSRDNVFNKIKSDFEFVDQLVIPADEFLKMNAILASTLAHSKALGCGLWTLD
jgi:hypothetical protein